MNRPSMAIITKFRKVAKSIQRLSLISCTQRINLPRNLYSRFDPDDFKNQMNWKTSLTKKGQNVII